MRVLTEFENKPLLFEHPRKVIHVNDPREISNALDEIDRHIDEGYFAAGFLSYEAGYSFEQKLFNQKIYKFPLLCFGIYDKPLKRRPAGGTSKNCKLSDFRINITEKDYVKDIETIKLHIESGDVYQITYCIKKKFGFTGDTWQLYNDLLKAQPVPYPSYVEADGFTILSLSPERFFNKSGENILTEPMKGTWWRGGNLISDVIERHRFSRDRKNRAENVMIADLLRNDLGRIGDNVRAPHLFKIAKYRTLFQMTSIVTGSVPNDIKLSRLFPAIFPSGSVTGAPKIRAMEIIREVENEERMIYTGAIGYITPQRDMYFNIPIRTILLRGNEGEMGIGGGIVWDSTAEGEWNEGLLKAKFLSDIVS